MIAVDMKMPENCVECRFSQGDYGYCHAMPENFCGYVYQSEDEGKPEWCPLIQVDKLITERVMSQEDLLSHSAKKIIDYVKFDTCRQMGKAIAEDEKHIIWSDMSDYCTDDFCGRFRCTAYVVNTEGMNKW